MEFIVVEKFDWAHRGVNIMTYNAGDTINTEDADLIRVATEEKWIKEPEAVKANVETGQGMPAPQKNPAQVADEAPQPRAKKKAPENKAVDGAPENK